MTLSPVETRVLGCLMEKERTTPETYPLTLNSLIAACNQSTNRDPVMTLGDREVENALDELRQKKLATVVFGAGSRVQKYRHILPDIYNLSPQEYALLCVLLLRGPQTVGELRGRAERMAEFAALTDAENALNGLTTGDEPLVRLLPARPGQKERRYVQLLSGEPVEIPAEPDGGERTPPPGRWGRAARRDAGAGSGESARAIGRTARKFRGIEARTGRVTLMRVNRVSSSERRADRRSR